MDRLVFTVGNSSMGDDGAGPLLAQMMQENPVLGWGVIDGGSSPENEIGQIKKLRPKELLIVDATEMGLNAGEIRFVDPKVIADMMFMSTHNMPLNYLVDELKAFVPDVKFVGIQPQTVAFYYPMCAAVTQAAQTVYNHLYHWQGGEEFLWLVAQVE